MDSQKKKSRFATLPEKVKAFHYLDKVLKQDPDHPELFKFLPGESDHTVAAHVGGSFTWVNARSVRRDMFGNVHQSPGTNPPRKKNSERLDAIEKLLDRNYPGWR